MPIQAHIPYSRGDIVSLIHERGEIEEEEHTAKGTRLHARVPRSMLPAVEEYLDSR